MKTAAIHALLAGPIAQAATHAKRSSLLVQVRQPLTSRVRCLRHCTGRTSTRPLLCWSSSRTSCTSEVRASTSVWPFTGCRQQQETLMQEHFVEVPKDVLQRWCGADRLPAGQHTSNPPGLDSLRTCDICCSTPLKQAASLAMLEAVMACPMPWQTSTRRSTGVLAARLSLSSCCTSISCTSIFPTQCQIFMGQ